MFQSSAEIWKEDGLHSVLPVAEMGSNKNMDEIFC